MIDAAASNNADVILLTEAIDLGWNGIGCSLVIDPKGEIKVKGPYGADTDTILYVDVVPVSRSVEGLEWQGYWNK